MAVTDLIHFAKKLTAGVATLRTLKLDCFPKCEHIFLPVVLLTAVQAAVVS